MRIEKEYDAHLCIVLQVLREKQLYAKFSKRFIEGFSLIAAPLTKLLRRWVLFNWTDKQQESFEKLKDVLTKAPVLIQPDKANVVADALSRRAVSALRAIFARLNLFDDGSLLAELQTDGQSERVIQILEDILRGSVNDFRGSWEDYLPLAEFAYNNSYPSKLISDTEDKVKLIRYRLKEASDRQKSCADLKRKKIEYSVGDYVFVKVSPWKKILRFGRKGKLSSRRYRSDPSHIVSVEEIEVGPDLTIEEEPVQILDLDVKVLRKKSILMVKVLWRNHSLEEAMWEPEEVVRQQYPHLF
ncbi:uncharacterized protein [Gossypium hirsutum]|uniref:Reverse transcriptase n=1 Tax=Gossypium hirsutum TaxID=3635 RepID=A0ABM2YQQ8_GOSHI|nr:uncharacterized protein LOC121206009 [Gossypium hirsutum]